jgi:hypothetical protein
MVLKGNNRKRTENPREMRLGSRAAAGMPVGEKLAQVKLPKLYIIGQRLAIR